jgi:hypothetical protein
MNNVVRALEERLAEELEQLSQLRYLLILKNEERYDNEKFKEVYQEVQDLRLAIREATGTWPPPVDAKLI